MSDDSRLWAAGAYLLLIFSGIAVLLMRKDDSYAKYHAMQSILFTVALVVISFLFVIVGMVLGLIPFLGKMIGFILAIAQVIVNLLVFLAWLFLMWKAFTGEKYRLPIVGEQAEKMASKA